jgi:hypothetical protein
VFLKKKASPGQPATVVDDNRYSQISKLGTGARARFVLEDAQSEIKVTISGLASGITGKWSMTYKNGLLEKSVTFPKGSCDNND